MTDVFSLLTLPTTSTAFTALKASVSDSLDGSASPRRKAARLDGDSDAASASRSTGHGQKGPIKLTIVGDQLPSKPRDGDAQSKLLRNLNLLHRSIRSIMTPPNPGDKRGDPRLIFPTTYEAIYSACRSVVTVANRGEDLYDKLRLELQQSIGQLSTALATREIEVLDKGDKHELPILWVTEFVRVCDWFEKTILLLSSLLTYLDQVTLAYAIVSEKVFNNPEVQSRIRSGILEWANYERKFRMTHHYRKKISKLFAHLIMHNQYTYYEAHYIKISREFYSAESAELTRSMTDAQLFFNHVKDRIEEEEVRSQDALPVGSWELVRKAVEDHIWGDRLEWVANNTIGLYVKRKDFARVEGIVKDEKDDDHMVERLLEFKSLADEVISTTFVDEKASLSSSAVITSRNPEFIYALGDAFSIGFKARRNKPAEMIAKYIDHAMRKGQNALSQDEYEATLDAALALYRFTDDKDVFRTFYHRSLAKRLLLQKSASDEVEASMLKKLREQYDPDFGMGEDMFKDLQLSRDAMRDYHMKLDSNSSGHKLSVMVLQRSAWPFTVQKTSVDLPPNMQADLTAFANYYRNRHTGHILDWDHALGTATLTARFNAGKKELSVSLYQAVVLLLFNNEIEWRYADILEQTRIEPEELKRILQSLACGKKKVLKKVPPGRDIDESDHFRFNPDFDDPRTKVHINTIQVKVSPQESKRTNDSIEGDRRHYLEAAIVRIMKARKELMYEQIKTATIEAVKNHFVPGVESIKKRVDWLVEQEYLRRDPDDKNRFYYVA
ncbi:hypothetical protein H0H87_002823 [Tephrocybe sp. NHM501043]|nr:hypothetical protein H0H87_002823 [Tephrocybe sp. NHM501043]